MRFVVTGSRGQLGRCLVEAIAARPGDVLVGAYAHAELDVADARQVAAIFERARGDVDVVINAAAFTAVDRCESERERAFAANAVGPGLLAEACARAGASLVHVSTDYVFDGLARSPYAESAPIAPRSEYGRSKAEGERRVRLALPDALVVRTSWVFGPGRNFVLAILEQAARRRRGEASGPLRVVDDQRGAPTYAADLADGLLALAARAFAPGERVGVARGEDAPGVVHLANRGETTWYGFARAILDATGHADLEIEKISTAELGLPAPRPAYSLFDLSRAERLGVRLRVWQDALAAYLRTLEASVSAAGARP